MGRLADGHSDRQRGRERNTDKEKIMTIERQTSTRTMILGERSASRCTERLVTVKTLLLLLLSLLQHNGITTPDTTATVITSTTTPTTFTTATTTITIALNKEEDRLTYD